MSRLSRYCDGVMEAAWLLALIVTPLFFNLDSKRPFEVEKVALMRTIIWFAFAVWLVKLISEGGLRFVHIPRPASLKAFFRMPLVLPTAVLALSYFLSTLFSIAPRVSLFGSYDRMDGFLTRISYLLLFTVIVVNLRRREQIERLLTILILASLPVSLYAILQHYDLDPYGLGKIGVKRSVATIGHPIFTSAFLSMSLIMIMSRGILAFQSLRNKGSSRTNDIIRFVLYILLGCLNIVAIIFTNSRGPLLGLMVGVFVFGLALLAHWRLRKVFYVFSTIAALSFSFLILLNLPNSPMAVLRDAPFVGPLGHIFDAQSGTGRMRSMMWDGMSRLVTPHAPLAFPDGGTDNFNFLRPIIGYGPETILFTFEGYYNPEMFILESRDVLFDRSHNEFWDSLALYGILGTLAEYGFFLALFYYALKWIGFISTKREQKLFWGLTLGGGLLGGLILTLWLGAGFIGIGLPLGLLAGTAGILIYNIFRRAPTDRSSLEPWQVITSIGILSAIISHYIEVLFGISVGITLVTLWSFAATLVIIGWIIPLLKVQERSTTEEVKSDSRLDLRRIGLNTLLVVAIMTVLTIDFISANHSLYADISAILGSSLIISTANGISYGVLWLIHGALTISVLLLQTEDDALHRRGFRPINLILTLGLALVVTVSTWALRAAQLATLKDISIARADSYLPNLFWRLDAFYIGIFILALAAGALLMEHGINARRASLKPQVLVACFGIPALAIVLSYLLNVQPVHADMAFAKAMTQASQGQYGPALRLLDRSVIPLAPKQTFYQTTASQLALQYSNSVPDPIQQTELATRSLEYGETAANLAPLFANHWIDVAFAYTRLGFLAQNQATQTRQYALANSAFSTALAMKPTRVDYWGGWAELLLIMGDLEGAQTKIEKALSIDPSFEPLYFTAGNIYVSAAEKENDLVRREELLNKALLSFQTEADLALKNGQDPALILVDVVSIQEMLQMYDEARETSLHIMELGLGDDQWQVYKKLADLSAKLNDISAQRDYLTQAIAIAPPDRVPALQSELDALNP